MEELTKLGTEADRLILKAFDLFMGCREKVLTLRIEELEKRLFKSGRESV